jgi:hypothetical protein
MKQLRSIDPAAAEIFEQTLQRVAGNFKITRMDPESGLHILQPFELLKKFESVFVHNVTLFEHAAGSFMILLVEKHQTIVAHKRTGARDIEIEETEALLIFTLAHNLGRVLILKETIVNKISNLFTKIDIDFEEYPDFSRNYLVVGSEPIRVRQYLPKELMTQLSKVRNLTVEINGHVGVVSTGKNLSSDALMLLISLGNKLTQSKL